ncbi:MAG: ATP synthase F1 subunit gamma [Clostridia bacterium]|nr:ATP synthase F1 subunit gamma [Clostridia bacterium]
MNNLTDIKNRMKAIGDTRKITKAMETVSIAKMSNAAQKCEQYSVYFDKLKDIMYDISLRTGDWVHPCFNTRKAGKTAFFVVSSDKGMVGAFNHNLTEFAYDKIKQSDNSAVYVLGEAAETFFDKKDIVIYKRFKPSNLFPSVNEAEKLADYFSDIFLNDCISEVYVIYSSFSSKFEVSPKMVKLLPIGREKTEERYLYEIFYEPTPEEVLEGLVPQYLSGIIYGCMLQSVAAEHFSRRMAMAAASKNADELLGELTKQFNSVRQNAVTSEISDIINSAYGVCDERNSAE